MIRTAEGLDPLAARKELQRRFPDADADLQRAASAQAELLSRARSRFPYADRLLWTSDGLEQATRYAAARYRADRLVSAGVASVADLTCGLGLDLIEMAAAGLDVTGVEIDPETADVARLNTTAARAAAPVRKDAADLRARVAPATPARIITGSCLDEQVLADLDVTAVFIDPARRGSHRRADGSHRRIDDPECWQPPWSRVRAFTERWPIVVAKAAPGIDHDLVADAAAEWVSVDGQLVETCAWWGLGSAGNRTAVVLDVAGGALGRVTGQDAAQQVVGLPSAGQWLVDPDPAIVRAGVVAEAAAQFHCGLLDEHLAYLVGDEAPPAWVGRSWRVHCAGAYDKAALRAECQAAGFADVVVSGRGRQLNESRVRRDLRLRDGDRTGRLVSVGLGKGRRTAVILTDLQTRTGHA